MEAYKNIFLLSIVLVNSTAYPQDMQMKIESLPIDPETNCYIRYYYYPNIQAYFDNLKLVYYYKLNDKWQTSSELPPVYCGYSLFNKWKVMITDFDEENPQQFLTIHKKKYPYNPKGRFTNETVYDD